MRGGILGGNGDVFVVVHGKVFRIDSTFLRRGVVNCRGVRIHPWDHRGVPGMSQNRLRIILIQRRIAAESIQGPVLRLGALQFSVFDAEAARLVPKKKKKQQRK